MRNDGGPAFHQTQTLDPEPGRGFVSGLDVAEGGMTMRDYFAAKAMQGFAADSNYGETLKVMAEWSYRWADAMLAEREKGRS